MQGESKCVQRDQGLLAKPKFQVPKSLQCLYDRTGQHIQLHSCMYSCILTRVLL